MFVWNRNLFHTLLLSSLSLSLLFFSLNSGAIAETYAVPQTTGVTLAWDPNDPSPDGYRIYQRAEGQTYDYSHPVWTGTANAGTVYNLDYDTHYYFVVRAYAADEESADSNEVSFMAPSPVTASHTITAAAGDNGSITPAGQTSVEDGGSIIYTITPDSGYRVADVAVNGVSQGAIASYTFSNVTADHSIQAVFLATTHTITATAGINGSITPAGSVEVAAGTSHSFTMMPDSGYHISEVIADGVVVGAATTHVFSNINENHTLVVNFAPDTYTLTASAGEGGSISPSGQKAVTYGSSQTFTIQADSGYDIQDLVVNGQSMGPVNSYTLSNIDSDYVIQATFASMNQAPVADAGPDQTVDEAQTVTLSGLNSVDFDDGIAVFQWRQIEGVNVALQNADQPVATFTAPDTDMSGTSLVFELTVTDNNQATSVDTCIVNVSWVNVPPTADAGGELVASEGTVVTLNAAGSTDPDDGIVRYQWQQLQGPAAALSGDTAPTVSFSAPDIGPEGASLIFQLTVTDAGGLQDTDTCLVTVEWINVPPLADAGLDQEVTVDDEVILDGSLSTDIDGDSIVAYRWRQTEGVPVNLSDPTAAMPSFMASDVGADGATLVFELTVTDSGGMLGMDSCQVLVAPAASAAIDTTAPILTIDSPAADGLNVNSATIAMSGSAGDDTGVEQVIWENDRGGNGVAVGTTQWQIDKIRLKKGPNLITVTAIDAAGNQTAVQKNIKYTR